MWNELESYKHHFLQTELTHLKPLAISPLVQKEFNATQSHRLKCNFTNAAENHKCEASTYFDDRAQLAYGFRALPKLLRELCSDDLKTQWRAINSLSEYVMNPLNAQRAINEFDMVRILSNAFLRHRHRYLDENYREIERMLEIFRIFAIYLNGARKIAKRKLLINEFYRIILKNSKHVDSTAAVLRNLTEKPEVLLYMYEHTDAYNFLADIFHVDNCRPRYAYNLWLHLSHFLEIAPEKGLELSFFKLLHQRIVTRAPEFCRLNMKCFALILRCEQGQKEFDEVDGVHMLYEIIENEMEPPLDTYEFIIMAFLHGLHSKQAMWRAREFTNLPKIMVKFALKKVHRNAHLQLYALKTLRLLGQMPCIKAYMFENCLKNLSSLKCLNEENECERVKLVHWLERDIFETDKDEEN